MGRPSRTRWPWGLVGMLAMVAAVESGFSLDPLRFADTTSLNWRIAFDDVAREAGRTEIACLGDSLTKIGVVPEVIRAGTGKRTYNFGMARAPAQATYFAFRRLLEAGGRPSALIVDFKPGLQSVRPKMGFRHFQEVANLRESCELAIDGGGPDPLSRFLLARLLPSTRYRLEIRESIRSVLAGQVAPTIRTNRMAARNWAANLGNQFNVSAPLGVSGDVPANILESQGAGDWRCHRINEAAIEGLFALANSRSIPVYWIIPPISPQLRAHREVAAIDDRYTAFARGLQARYPGVTVVDARQSGYEAASFSDFTHLNGRGSLAFSHELAAIVARPDGRPRWIDLRRYRDWPLDVPVEDIAQSRIAVEGETSRR